MLKKIARRTAEKSGGKFAIVAAKYNAKYTNALVASAQAEFRAGGAERVEVFRVPGAFETPVIAAKLAEAENPHFDVIICFGVVLRGETAHAQHITEAVSFALAELQVRAKIPIVHGVLLFENEEQAKVRCLGKEHNRGMEAARTALEMFKVVEGLGKYMSVPIAEWEKQFRAARKSSARRGERQLR
ncbi:MAG TPA: 6,7-dimethyl-8-ribityllumazine synthase [Verrucomicrobiae bacterium]|jgi:6,7-dimethyl-8-ribityllumazine synthase|nr:6,7-dimethyl-8-ribityllumazine synthase [Verrucomicrobiae bacterium]